LVQSSNSRVLVDLAYFILRYYLSPMVANSAPVLVRGEKLVDAGRFFIDGKPVFGSHKTWEGFTAGLTMGFISSSIVGIIFDSLYTTLLNMTGVVTALAGDLAGAFLKRRLNLKPGDPLPVVDQLDFAVASTLLYFFLDRDFASQPLLIAISLLVILLLHLATNNIAFALRLKNKRW